MLQMQSIKLQEEELLKMQNDYFNAYFLLLTLSFVR